jgi:hypothetical protein
MKIYIDNYKPINLIDKLELLEKYYTKHENIIEIYSTNGIFNINNKKIIQVIPYNDVKSYMIQNYYKNINLIIDNSIFLKEEINYLPNEHIHLNSTIFTYSINDKSIIKLIIEGYDKKDSDNLQNNHEQDKYHNFIPNNFYFEINDNNINLKDSTIKTELIVFLSLLN